MIEFVVGAVIGGIITFAAGVEALLPLARAHGWEMPPGQEVAS